jgi:iron-sulfur cluster assembly accessory protein
MEQFINITPAAIDFIKTSVEIEKCLGVRIDVKSGGCQGLTYALEFVTDINSADLLMEKDGVNIYISSKAAIFVANMTMDYVKTPMGGNITFENPNAKMSCSCGKSFCVDAMDGNSCFGKCRSE